MLLRGELQFPKKNIIYRRIMCVEARRRIGRKYPAMKPRTQTVETDRCTNSSIDIANEELFYSREEDGIEITEKQVRERNETILSGCFELDSSVQAIVSEDYCKKTQENF